MLPQQGSGAQGQAFERINTQLVRALLRKAANMAAPMGDQIQPASPRCSGNGTSTESLSM